MLFRWFAGFFLIKMLYEHSFTRTTFEGRHAHFHKENTAAALEMDWFFCV